jgi:hypothetical protein
MTEQSIHLIKVHSISCQDVYLEDQGSGKEDLGARDLAPEQVFERGTVLLVMLIFLHPKSNVMLLN